MAPQRKRPLITAAKPSRLNNFLIRRNLLRRIGRELRHRIDFELGELRHRIDSTSMEGIIRVIRKSSFGHMTINDLLKDEEQPTQPMSQSIQQPMSQSIQQPMPQSIQHPMPQSIQHPMPQSIQQPMPQSISQSMYPMVKVKVEEEEEPQPMVKVEEEEEPQPMVKVKVEEEEEPQPMVKVKVEEEEEPQPMVKVKVEEEEEPQPMPQSMVKVKVEEEEEEETKPVLDSLEDVLASLTNAGFSSDLPVDLTLFNFSDLMDLSFTI